ncbi:MAG: hypothetical protein V4615_11440 [Bacteroidota bacterium]
MNHSAAAILCICLSLCISSCKKEEQEKELFPVVLNDSSIVFSNATSDTAFLEFALIRIAEARIFNGRLNDGFYLDTGTLPVALPPNEMVELEKNRFVYKTDTLRTQDQPKNIAYNFRYLADGDSVRRVKTFSKDF